MRTHAVHSEGEQCKIPAAPIKCTGNIMMPLCLEFAIVRTRHVVELMRRSDSHEGDAIFELVADLNNLMLVHVKIV